eukprot:scaffold6089_cov114-Skeletonema_menzelii.AAC.4
MSRITQRHQTLPGGSNRVDFIIALKRKLILPLYPVRSCFRPNMQMWSPIFDLYYLYLYVYGQHQCRAASAKVRHQQSINTSMKTWPHANPPTPTDSSYVQSHRSIEPVEVLGGRSWRYWRLGGSLSNSPHK